MPDQTSETPTPVTEPAATHPPEVESEPETAQPEVAAETAPEEAEAAAEAPAEEAASEEPAAQAEEATSEEPAAPAEEAASEEPAAQAEEVKVSEEPAAAQAEEVEAAGEEEPAAQAEEVEAAGEVEASEEPAAAQAGEAAVEEPVAVQAEESAGATAETPAEEPAAAKPEADEDPAPSDTMTELEKALAEKTPVKGQVIGWNKGGYHVAIGKIAAFCPVSQIEIGNPRSPKSYLDKTFDFRVLEIEERGRRVVVSRSEALKAAKEARAQLVRERLKPGTVVEGRVSSLTDFGAFVNLGGDIEGLVHISELSRRRVEHPKELVQKGQEVKVSVLRVEKNGERISLSMKRLEEDPWKKVQERYPAGDKFEGTILRKADFGLFVEVEPGLEGLVHTSRLPLGKSLEDESLEPGQKVEGWVHDVDRKRRRLSLSLREVAQGNPWRGITDRYPVGEVVKGKVEKLANFGVFVELEPGLTGLLPFSVLGDGGGNPRRRFHPGKEVSVRVLSIDRDKRRISLGTETSRAEGSREDYKDYMKNQKSGRGGGLTSLAAAFEKVKDRIEASS